MEKEILNITNFGGIVNRVESTDLPDNIATDSDHVDGEATNGKLVGIPALATTTYAPATFNKGAWIKTNDGKWNLAWTSLTNLYVHKDWYGTPADAGLSVAYYGSSFVNNNQEVHVACGTSNEPQWMGYIPYGHFGSSAHGWFAGDAKIPILQPITNDLYVSAATPHAGTMAFETEYRYDYIVSIVYDYTQESPLPTSYFSYSEISTLTQADYVTITITAKGASGLNKRITGCKLYRRKINNNDTSDVTLWRLLQSVTVTSTTGYSTTSWSVESGGNRTITFLDYNTTEGDATYEQETGMPETLQSSHLKYTLNTSLNGYHYVANCAKSEIPDANMMLFRSKPYRYDMFDWSTLGEYMKLPTVPLALAQFANRLWAFDENRIYRINPELMMIEDVTEGIGCLSQRSLVVTDYGMFWCDAKGAYMHDGTNIIPISDTIKYATATIPGSPGTTHWHGFTYDYTIGAQSTTPVVIFNSQKNYVMFVVLSSSANKVQCWAYHVMLKRWDKWSNLTTCSSAAGGLFTGKDGEIYCANGAAVSKPLGGTTTRACEWTSKDLEFGEPSQNKRFYKILIQQTGTDTISVTYTLDGSATTTTAPVTFSPTNGKKLKVKISLDAGENVNSCSIMYRKFLGNR